MRVAMQNPSTKDSEVAELEKQLERIRWAKEEHEEWINGGDEEVDAAFPETPSEEPPRPIGTVEGEGEGEAVRLRPTTSLSENTPPSLRTVA